jgi:hypothetical protein
MKFAQMVLRPGILALLIAGLSAAALVLATTVVIGEARLLDAKSLNQWLARDIASQFTGVATRTLARAQKFGDLVRRESGTFDAPAKREFDLDPSLKAIWVLDATGAGPLQPVARLERDGFTLLEAQTESVRRLTDSAIEQGSAAQGITQGLSAVALKLGDMPRTVVLFTDESIFSRASGGPWGDKWMLLAPSLDRTEAVLIEATSQLRESVAFPSFDEISRLVKAQNPAEARTEFSSEMIAANGAAFQVSGVQTGAFGVMAVAVTPLEGISSSASLLFKLAAGIAISISILVMLLQALRMLGSRKAAPHPETPPPSIAV